MYNLNNFCNIISQLRQEKKWTQTELADRLGISPQSISKWECGIGFPDVTLFPVLAETLEVPIGILFGETTRQKEDMTMEDVHKRTEFTEEFEICGTITVKCGNVCRIEFISGEREKGYVHAVGDPVFLRYLALERVSGEKEPDELLVNIKNPTGSKNCWKPYDRQGFTGENYVQIFTGTSIDSTDEYFWNYLDLKMTSATNPQGNFEAVCSADNKKQ